MVCLSDNYNLKHIDEMSCRSLKTLEILNHLFEAHDIAPTFPHLPNLPMLLATKPVVPSDVYLDQPPSNLDTSSISNAPSASEMSHKDQVLIGMLSTIFVIAGIAGFFFLCKIQNCHLANDKSERFLKI